MFQCAVPCCFGAAAAAHAHQPLGMRPLLAVQGCQQSLLDMCLTLAVPASVSHISGASPFSMGKLQ